MHPISDFAAATPDAPRAAPRIALGEELPLFCERCGYSLHGLPQNVCDHCSIRQFHCPECGHHQPINTLRPTFQKLLGRIRAFVLALLVFVKINFFGWLLFAWVMVGYESTYHRRYESVPLTGPGPATPPVVRLVPVELDAEQVVGFSLFALAFGTVGRMLLLRWRRGYLVGLAFAALVCLMIVLGAYWRKWDRSDANTVVPSPLGRDFFIYLAITAAMLFAGAATVWGVWTALVHVFLPRRTSQALLEYQRSLSNPPAAHLGRE